jgi:putative heme-binding domain-containing protein
MPESWISQLGNELSAANTVELKLKILKLIRLHGSASMTGSLAQLASNKNNSSVLRIAAIGTLLDADSIITNDHFNYLYDQLQNTNDAPARQQAATVLGQASLSNEHLTKLAHYLPNADAFILPRLMPVFKGVKNVEIGKAVITALSNSPSLDTFTEEYIRTTLAGYPPEVKPSVNQLITKLIDVRKERLTRLQAIENKINEGDIERGRILFFEKAICYTCHTIGNEGGNFGPDLTSIQRDRSMHDLVEAVVFPSVSFVREYETYQIKTKENTFTGVIQEQTNDMILLGISPQESVRIRSDEIVSTEIQDVSMMPQGLDQLLTEQEMADLLAFLIGQDQDPETDSDLLR